MMAYVNLDCSVSLAPIQATLADMRWANVALPNGTRTGEMNRHIDSQTFEDGIQIFSKRLASFCPFDLSGICLDEILDRTFPLHKH